MSRKRIGLEETFMYGSKEAVIQNLKDAGCSLATIARCMECLDCGKETELLKQLERHRNGLLQKVHEEEKQIGCLDYLVYQINRCRCQIKETEENSK